jgi:hypothetical protein
LFKLPVKKEITVTTNLNDDQRADERCRLQTIEIGGCLQLTRRGGLTVSMCLHHSPVRYRCPGWEWVESKLNCIVKISMKKRKRSKILPPKWVSDTT